MDKIIKSLKELQNINMIYSLSNETIEKLLSEVDTAKVCTPIIGKFSSGKSALLNTILGYSKKILKEDITPETAVPAEITYSADADNLCVIKNDSTHESISVADYRQLEVDANTVRCTRLNLKNSFLEEIPDVMLVDMPGFESGFEVHNRAIDNYLPQSLAYIIAFPADDMIVRSSVGDILKELCLHDMPICIVITKSDKRNNDFEATFAAMKESLKRFIGEREVTYCVTSSLNGEVEEVEEFLRGIQEKSQEILANKFRNAVLSEIDVTENYLNTILKNSELSESELNEQEERLGKQLNDLNTRFSKEKDDFDLQISECVEEIKSDVQMALETEESSFVAMAMNKQNINDRMNVVVRNAVTASIKKRFIPKVERYLKRVENCMDGDCVGDVSISLNVDIEDAGKGVISATVAAAAATVIAGPIIGMLVGHFINWISSTRGDKKREEAKGEIRQKLNNEIYPQVLKEVGNSIETAITKQLKLINTSIENELTVQRTTLEKAMEDVRTKMSDEQEHKEKLAMDIKTDMDKIGALKIGLI